MTRDATGRTRRGLFAGVAGVGIAALGGCASGVGGGVSTASGEYGGWMAGAAGYGGETVDRTGESTVTVAVGAGEGFAFDPAAVEVTVGTTVRWEWTGEGRRHNVIEVGDGYRSQLYALEGKTFAHTFDESGVSNYYCNPHRSLGMKGVVAVVEG